MCSFYEFTRKTKFDFVCYTFSLKSHPWSDRAVGRVVILLIDALRADFVLNHDQLANLGVHYQDVGEGRPKIPFLREMLKKDQAICLVAETTPPTVTLPRLKVAI